MNILNLFLSLFAPKPPLNSFPTINTGVLGGHREEDYVAGTLPFEVRNASGDWRAYLPDANEFQYSSRADFMDCVSFSLTNSLEIQARKLSDQKFNWSDRFLGKMSETTRQGNYQYKVADIVRKYGLVNESTWPMPLNATWDEYYSEIPQEVIARAKQDFPFTVQYEWVFNSQSTLTAGQKKSALQYHLQHAPIQITIPGQNPNHAVCLVAIVGDLYYYYDSYAPFLKTMSTPPSGALKVVLYDNRIIMRQVGWNDAEKGLYVGFDTLDRQAKFFAAMKTLFPDYRVEEKEWNLGKRPWS